MDYYKTSFILLIGLFMLPFAHGAPNLTNYLPMNDSFFGRGSVNFYVNITSPSLNNAKLFVISEDAYTNGESWDMYTMTCTGGPEYNCTKSVSFSIAGTDTLEFFYFEANGSGGVSSLGNATDYFKFKLDRNPPSITFVRPANESFVSGNVTVEVSVSDAISGVNMSSLQLSLDNSTWTGMNNSIGYFNSSDYANNQTLTVYVRASDNLSNTGTAAINATVDNEPPRIGVTSHPNGATVKDIVSFSVNVLDSFSNISGAKFSIAGSDSSMTCSGSKNATCSISVNTLQLPDNPYNLTFTANDTAGNTNSTNLSVTINNNKPVVTLSPEGYAKGSINVSAALTNPGSIITGVSLKMEKTGFSSNLSFSCNSQFTSCTHSMNTASYSDGSYTLTANVSNMLNHTAYDTSSVVIDNTKPAITIDGPSSAVSSTFTISATVTDTNHDRTQVSYAIVGSGAMSCVAQDNKLLCNAQYDPSGLSNGDHTLTVTAVDAAGNSNSSSKTVTVDKSGGSGSGSGSGGSSGSGSGSSGNGTSSGNGGLGCGDNVCALSETCTTCSKDCGVCRTGEGGSSSDPDNPNNTNNPGNNPFSFLGDGLEQTISSNPMPFAVIGIALVAAGVAFKVLRKKKTAVGQKPRKEVKKVKENRKSQEKPFIFGEK